MKKPAAVKPNKFYLYGLLGEFSVLPESKWKVCHFSTKASSDDAGSGGHCLSLLKELKPVRERIEADKINDMSSLLQRDLSDFRVANDLIPYLLQNEVGIGFFPGILVALVPKGFLSNNSSSSVNYPNREDKDGSATLLRFGDCWDLELYQDDDDKNIALGRIGIDPAKTDLIVLDGQHRANAFRYMTNTFEQASGEKATVYKPFYSNCPQPPEKFKSELPVTLVWFEKTGDDEVSPLIISRRLFVDVNTNAKRVNESRNILLDDQSLSSICTANFYSKLAEKSFSSNALSLLQSGFDSDGNTDSELSLFSPSVINYSFSMFAIGKDEFNDIDFLVYRESYKKQNNINRLEKFFVNLSEDEIPQLSPLYHVPKIHAALSKSFTDIVCRALSGFCLIKKHVEATELLSQWITDEASTTLKDVWKKVYMGGEGLFSNYMSFQNSGIRPTNDVENYINAIKEIEGKFLNIRRSLFKSEFGDYVDPAYRTLATKASLTGLLMSLSRFSENKGWVYKEEDTFFYSVDEFCNALNMTSHDEWINIMTSLKKDAVGSELSPKLWTKMRNIFLRILQNNCKERTFYD